MGSKEEETRQGSGDRWGVKVGGSAILRWAGERRLVDFTGKTTGTKIPAVKREISQKKSTDLVAILHTTKFRSDISCVIIAALLDEFLHSCRNKLAGKSVSYRYDF